MTAQGPGRATIARWPARAALALAALLLALLAARRLWQFAAAPGVIDFTHFWSAGWLALHGRAAEAYDPYLSPFGEVAALAYPPSYLLLVTPLGLIDLLPALAVWLALGALLYLAAARRWLGIALAHPPAAYNALIGQNGFLSASAILFGAAAIDRRPLVGGALLGLVSLKPQLVPLIVVALLAGRFWRALGAAAAVTVALNVLAAALFGLGLYERFLVILSTQGALLQEGHWNWTVVASTYGFVRWFGAGDTLAWTAQAATAAAAGIAVWVAWRHDWQAKVPVLAAGIMLLSPYLFSYDAVVLVAAIGSLAATRPMAAAIAWALTLPPFVMAVGPYSGPNTIPLAALVCLAALCWLHKVPSLKAAVPNP